MGVDVQSPEMLHTVVSLSLPLNLSLSSFPPSPPLQSRFANFKNFSNCACMSVLVDRVHALVKPQGQVITKIIIACLPDSPSI